MCRMRFSDGLGGGGYEYYNSILYQKSVHKDFLFS